MIRSGEQAEYMAIPRLLAVAERAWHVADWQMAINLIVLKASRTRDWNKFSAAVGIRELRRLDRMGIRYRLAPPGIRSGATLTFGE